MWGLITVVDHLSLLIRQIPAWIRHDVIAQANVGLFLPTVTCSGAPKNGIAIDSQVEEQDGA
jgi:hypothetical protein